MSKYKILVCSRCGAEERISIYSREEAKSKNIRLGPPRCSRCGSTNVQLHD